MGDEKLLKKFLGDKTRITVDDCDRLLILHGYQLSKGSGSHRVYHKKGAPPITIVTPKKARYVFVVYVNTLLKHLGLEG
jgi:predicted RNA binding protein YcfA (HicA-like mRNA interferase family)